MRDRFAGSRANTGFCVRAVENYIHDRWRSKRRYGTTHECQEERAGFVFHFISSFWRALSRDSGAWWIWFHGLDPPLNIFKFWLKFSGDPTDLLKLFFYLTIA